MTRAPVYPPAQALVEAHRRLLEAYGGSPGLRDPDALAAAIARAEQIRAYAEQPPDVFRLAAATAYGIARIRHPFVDGNKRVAFVALFITLDLNGFYLDAPETEAAEMLERVSAGTAGEEDLVAWVVRHSVPIDPDAPV